MRIFGRVPPPSEIGVLEHLTPQVRRMLVGNSGVFTATGTCTYVVGHGEVTVIDPGPASPEHISRLTKALNGERVARIIATHRHEDHSPGARLLQETSGAPVVGSAGSVFEDDCRIERPVLSANSGIDEDFRPDVPVREGDVLTGDDWEIEVLETRGHTADHLCLSLNGGEVLFTGDHIMEWAPPVIYPPEGDMRGYRQSLKRMLEGSFQRLFPGHGGPIEDPSGFMMALLKHRGSREQRVVERILDGDRSVGDIMNHLYQGIDPALRGAAGATVFAHLLDLESRGLITLSGNTAKTCVIESALPDIRNQADPWRA